MSRLPTHLRRDQEEVVLHDPFEPPFLLRFRTAEDVVRYLRFWRGSSSAMSGLRDALRRASGAPARPWSDDEVIEAVATLVHAGTLALSASSALHSLPESLRPPVPQAVPGAGAIPAVPALPVPPLLPRLELLQIETADVLIEINQGLGEVRSAMGSIGGAGVSLEPVPQGVPPIQAGLSKASASIQSTLRGG
jgi:hypothetical protein